MSDHLHFVCVSCGVKKPVMHRFVQRGKWSKFCGGCIKNCKYHIRNEKGDVVHRSDALQQTSFQRNWNSCFSRLACDIRKRARKKGIECDITKEDVEKMYDRQGGLCALTGVEFQLDSNSQARCSPYRPSIDRIKSNGGYTKNNTQMVTVQVNLAKNDWSQSNFDMMCRARVEMLECTSISSAKA